MLERARLIAHRFGWSKDEDLVMAFDLVTGGGARALGIDRYGVEAGCQANLVLLDAENIAEAVVDSGLRRTVISRGRVVARDGAYIGA
jgi:cytosine deaminase